MTDLINLLRGLRVVALTGAGCSTESGIPGYRDAAGRLVARAPLQFGEFVRSAEARARYWSRSAIGWPRFRAARPNPAHAALARLEDAGAVAGVLTQNVDGLHRAAGSRRVIELHGALDRVRCLACGDRTRRDDLQARIEAENGDWLAARAAAPVAPDGDAALDADAVAGFRVPGCAACGGALKPDVVLFGESVPRDRLDRAWALFGEARVLLVVGSSLAVFSGRRFVQRAARDGVPVAVINLGATRADDVAVARVDGRAGEVLPALAEALAGRLDGLPA